jgi:serine protease SohB
MAHELFKLYQKLTNTPHLVTSEALGKAISYIEARNGETEFAILGSPNKEYRTPQYNEDTKTGVVTVDGPLTYIAYQGLCGESGCSYQQITEDFEQLISEGATTIVLDVDGPGGEAYSMMETGRYLRKVADEKGINLIAYIDGMSASATYGITSSAHEVVINPEATAGSIGVVVKLRNANKALKSMGIEDTYVYAGESKIPFDSEGDFTESFLNDLQDKVDTLYTNFVTYISEMRSIEVNAVKSTKAKMFLSDEAQAIGLVDKIMTREEFANYLADVSEGKTTLIKLKPTSNTPSASVETQEDDSMQLAELQAQVLELTNKLDAAAATAEQLQATLTGKDAQLATLQATVETLQAQAEAKAKAELEDKMNARKARLTACLDEEKSLSIFASTEQLSDEAFEAVAVAFEAQAAAQAKTTPFKELGHDGEGVGVKPANAVKAVLEKQYNK